MRILLLTILSLFSAVAFSQACFGPGVCNTPSCPEGQHWDDCNRTSAGPGACVPKCVGNPVSNEPTGPVELCLPEGCHPVSYAWLGNLVIAESILPNGYAVMGWSGPCLELNRGQCPDIMNQAFADLRMNALRAHRAQRYE